ncbi:MAG: DUF4352 domain-containing protein [Anaerolineae bacterium]|nr:DUF4352 domain-containing protein [Anaerolineae bacterium]
MGDAVEREGYLLSALTVEDPAPPSPLYFPEEGKRLIAVEIVVGNISGARLGINPLCVTLVDREGRSYPPELGAREGQLATIVLDRGERVRGWVAFKVPDSTVPTVLRMSKELFGEPFLEIGISPPPATHHPATVPFNRIKPPLPRMAETVVGAGYSLKVLAIEDPTLPSALYLIEPGQRLVGVKVVVGNVSATTQVVSPLFFILVDSQGFVYPATVRARNEEIGSLDLDPGETAQGWVAFSIPEDVVCESLKFVPSLGSEQGLQVDLTN